MATKQVEPVHKFVNPDRVCDRDHTSMGEYNVVNMAKGWAKKHEKALKGRPWKGDVKMYILDMMSAKPEEARLLRAVIALREEEMRKRG